jgi:hypothetical protein
VVPVLFGLFLTSAALLWFVLHDAEANTLKFEIAKAILQLGVVSVIGAIVSLFTFEFQRARQLADKEREIDHKNLEYREDLLKSTLARMTAAYSAVKKARRLLRARAILSRDRPAPCVLGKPYDSYMDVVNDAQLEVENLARDIHTSAPAFSDSKSLVAELYAIDFYLGTLISEYENTRGEFEGEEPEKALGELAALQEFIGRAKGGPFKEHVIVPYHKIQKAIREDLLHPQLL